MDWHWVPILLVSGIFSWVQVLLLWLRYSPISSDVYKRQGHTNNGVQTEFLGEHQADGNHGNDLVTGGECADEAVDEEYHRHQDIDADVYKRQ